MKIPNTARPLILIIGDCAAFYAALFVMLYLRYGTGLYVSLGDHLLPFTIVFVLWLAVFFASGLYDLARLKNNIDFFKILSTAFIISSLLTIALFYIVSFGIAPRRNLFLFIVIFWVVEGLWRRYFNIHAGFHGNLIKVLLLGRGEKFEELINEIKTNPQLGYEIQRWQKEGVDAEAADEIHSLALRHEAGVVVVPHAAAKDLKLAMVFYDLLAAGIMVFDFPSFYEDIFRKIPLSELEATWFLEHVNTRQRFYDNLKRAIEFAFALMLIIILSPLFLLIAVLVKITSRGPVIYSQIRVGYKNHPFTLYKFRTMYSDAEKDGPKWASAKDSRITPIGKMLRYTHLDELPQLRNILAGELSFVGPRPERPEFVRLLEEKIKYYDIRHLIKPGITGWAQINYRYGSSVEDALEKLQYDVYYLKNRSPILDVAIVFKTLRSFFVNNK